MASTILFWISLLIIGFIILVFASQKAIHHATKLAWALGVPPFIIGITLVSIGTDLPEIANSIIASLAGHGDLNVGDSVGSVATQITLVLGFLPFLGGGYKLVTNRFLFINLFTIAALGLGALLAMDGFLSRTDALILIFAWILTTIIFLKTGPKVVEHKEAYALNQKFKHGALAIGSLAVVGIGGIAVVKSVIELAQFTSIPEYYISFFGTSLGTSLPELAVEYTAVKSQSKEIAIGDITGSCLVDATLSISSGPLIAPTVVTAALAVKGAFITMIIVAISISLILSRKKHDNKTGVALLLLYLAIYFFFIY